MEQSPERKYQAAARSVPIPSNQRNAELSTIIMEGAGDDRDMAVMEMVNGHMRMVLNLTRQYRSMPDFADTLFDGNFGLIKAVLTYDYRKGKFSTWATHKIKTEIRDGILSRLNSPLSVTRYATELAFKMKDIKPDKNGDVVLPDVQVAKLAMLGIMDAIPLYDENGSPIEVEDLKTESAFDEVQRNDLLEFVRKATDELGLTDDEIALVSETGCKSNGGSMVSSIAEKLGISSSAVRMRRAKLLWKIRRKILSYVGKDEYLLLSEVGHIPPNNWR